MALRSVSNIVCSVDFTVTLGSDKVLERKKYPKEGFFLKIGRSTRTYFIL